MAFVGFFNSYLVLVWIIIIIIISFRFRFFMGFFLAEIHPNTVDH